MKSAGCSGKSIHEGRALFVICLVLVLSTRAKVQNAKSVDGRGNVLEGEVADESASNVERDITKLCSDGLQHMSASYPGAQRRCGGGGHGVVDEGAIEVQLALPTTASWSTTRHKGWAPQGPDAEQSYRRLVCAKVFQQPIDGTSIYNYKPTTKKRCVWEGYHRYCGGRETRYQLFQN